MSALIWNIKHFKKCKVTRLLGMMFESGTPKSKVIQKGYNIHASHQNSQTMYQNEAIVEGFELLELKFVELNHFENW